MSQYSYLAFVYFNNEKPLLEFLFTEITHLTDIKSILENLYPDNKRFVKLYYCSPSIDSERKIQFNKFDLETNEDLTVMWSTFHRYETKGLIKVDAKIARSTGDILKIFKCPQPSLDDEMYC